MRSRQPTQQPPPRLYHSADYYPGSWLLEDISSVHLRIPLHDNWKFHRADNKFAGHACVPGAIHTDLLENGLIQDPLVGMNEQEQRWISEYAWIYTCKFDLNAEILDQGPMDLVCEGLDTLASVYLNGNLLGQADNMFRTWRWEIDDSLLHTHKNELIIAFRPALLEGRERQRHDFVRTSDDGAFRLDGGQWIRKEQCNFGWDWGPPCVTCGIWKPIFLETRSSPRLQSLRMQQSVTEACAKVMVTPVCLHAPAGSSYKAEIKLRGEPVATAVMSAFVDTPVCLDVENPELWWPNGWGNPALYDLELSLLDAEGGVLGQLHRRIGLRTVELVREPDKEGQSFYFRINGQNIFAKGANWIPADVFASRIPEARYRHLLSSAREVGMNMIRVWGGGIYEPDTFYDICDELGLMVWQDFMFACSAYPVHDHAWLANVCIEAAEQVERLHGHACLALWCGNNEIEQFPFLLREDRDRGAMTPGAFKLLFEDRLPSIVNAIAPGAHYWPGSPRSEDGSDANDGRTGDAHFWDVWWGLEPFESYAKFRPRFCSEFGFQSFPSVRTLESVVPDGERNISSATMDHLQRGNTRLGTGNGTILAYLSANFRVPGDFDTMLLLSQILQGLALQQAVHAWRIQTPRCMGTLYWQLNDCWPGASWSTIDYAGEWKASHYFARRFFAPDLISGKILKNEGLLEAVFVGDRPPAVVTFSLVVTTPDGEVVNRQEVRDVGVSPGIPVSQVFPVAELLESFGARRLLFWIEAVSDGERIAEDLVLAVKPKHLAQVEPGLMAERVETADGPALRITATSGCALWAWLDSSASGGRWRENFFHVRPGVERTVSFSGAEIPPFTLSCLLNTYS